MSNFLHCWSKNNSTVEFLGQLKKLGDDGNATDAGSDQHMSILTILEKIKEMRLKFPQGSVTVL